jgi:ribosome biogenesis GTPase
VRDEAGTRPARARGVVARVDFGSCTVLHDDGTLSETTVRGRVMGPRKSLGNAVVVGDAVHLETAGGSAGGRAVIADVEPRRNAFSRRAAGREPLEQVVAANLDQVVLVAAWRDPEFRAGLADRILGQAEHAGVPARLVLTKLDLADDADARRDVQGILDDYARAGIPVHGVSALDGRGVPELRHACAGRRSLFVGHSGVGKSRLLNALVPGLELLVGQVNPRTGKGRHTTTAAWLVRPEPGLEVIDTPGMRAFGMWGIGPRDLDQVYLEFRPFLGACQFADCSHDHEPGCAVRAAVAAGAITTRRHASFLKLRAELEGDGR